jgi:hypothetical protein
MKLSIIDCVCSPESEKLKAKLIANGVNGVVQILKTKNGSIYAIDSDSNIYKLSKEAI